MGWRGKDGLEGGSAGPPARWLRPFRLGFGSREGRSGVPPAGGTPKRGVPPTAPALPPWATRGRSPLLAAWAGADSTQQVPCRVPLRDNSLRIREGPKAGSRPCLPAVPTRRSGTRFDRCGRAAERRELALIAAALGRTAPPRTSRPPPPSLGRFGHPSRGGGAQRPALRAASVRAGGGRGGRDNKQAGRGYFLMRNGNDAPAIPEPRRRMVSKGKDVVRKLLATHVDARFQSA
jgi:hypothetical protein